MGTTNTSVAERLGVSHVQISRIRSGNRYPSQKLMLLIEAWLSWPLADQAAKRWDADPQAYAREFDARLAAAE
jgi:transcriptional regulator with XRE-family HTH domain